MILKKAFWLFGIVFTLFVLFLPGYTKLQELRDRNRDLESKIRILNRENQVLLQEFERLKNDPAYLEKFAREKTGVVRKGEIPIRIVPAE